MSERWRPVPGHDGYEVSDLGRVRSINRLVQRGLHFVRRKGCDLKPATSRSGHRCVVLAPAGTKQIHAIVMLAFVGPYPEGAEILHLDGDASNNALVNLKYGTRAENVRQAYRVDRTIPTVSVEVTAPDGFVRTFPSITEAAQHFGLRPTHLTTALHRGCRCSGHSIRRL